MAVRVDYPAEVKVALSASLYMTTKCSGKVVSHERSLALIATHLAGLEWVRLNMISLMLEFQSDGNHGAACQSNVNTRTHFVEIMSVQVSK